MNGENINIYLIIIVIVICFIISMLLISYFKININNETGFVKLTKQYIKEGYDNIKEHEDINESDKKAIDGILNILSGNN